MEFNQIFINENLIHIIFNHLSTHDKLSFFRVNKFTYLNYKEKIKLGIYKFINYDYLKFKTHLDNNKYSVYDIKEIGLKAVKEITMVWRTDYMAFFDLRYIFELIYLNLDIHDKDIKSNLKFNSLFMFMKRIKQCLDLNRTMTIWKILNEPMLYTLHSDFDGCLKNGVAWSPIKI